MAKRFRTTWTQMAGNDGAEFYQARIVNVNLVAWTVDVVTTYDRHQFFNIQVAGPYLNPTRGEGIYAFPEIGSVCMVCIPGDSAPPFVAAFVMPYETIDMSGEGAPVGINSNSEPQEGGDSPTYAGGRPTPKPGDIMLRGRDGNFVALHRGGVLQIGATELSQRIFIPIRNFMMDISQNYAHHNSAGSVIWGLAEAGEKKQYPAYKRETVRVYANDQYADIRITSGQVQDDTGEPKGDDGDQGKLNELQIGTNKKKTPILFEVVVSPSGFVADTGQVKDKDTPNKAVFRFLFDRDGGTFLRCKGSLLVSSKKKISIMSSDNMELLSKKDITVHADGSMTIEAGPLLELKAKVVKINGGSSGLARLGDVIKITVAIPTGLGLVGAGGVPLAPLAPLTVAPGGGPVMAPSLAGGPVPVCSGILGSITGVIGTANASILG